MSNWIDKDLFQKFAQAKETEGDQQSGDQSNRRYGLVWKNPEMGTPEKPKVYTGRFLPDPDGIFYKKYHYHMFRSGEKWNFLLCDKTFDFNNFCPWCYATQQLYMGSKQDKLAAKNYARKDKFTGNFYIVEDPRDVEIPSEDEEKKVSGKVRIYDFPGKLESKIKAEITDKQNGLGHLIFDPSGEGYNFIIKVKSTKPAGEDKKVWPDYSDSVFARRPTALGTDDEIKVIMTSRYKINEYLNSMKRTPQETIDLLNQEMLWDIVAKEYEKNLKIKGIELKEAETNLSVEEGDNDDIPFDETPTKESSSSDDDLLKELEGM